jgi:polyhydroxybutyrate depolymerase
MDDRQLGPENKVYAPNEVIGMKIWLSWLPCRITIFVALFVLLSSETSVGQVSETLVYQGVDRHYILHTAPNRAGPVPVVVALHGLNQPLQELRESWTMEVVADREGFAVIYPEAVAGRWAYADSRPVGLPGGGLVDDTGFLLSLLDRLTEERVIDAEHVYVAGVSNGGLMAWTMACEASDRVAAVAALISGMIERQAEQCHPKRLVPLVVIAGTDDWMQAYDGALAPEFRLMSIPETLEFWRRLRGCASKSAKVIPRHDSADPTRAVIVEWTECKDTSPQWFYRIEGGGHSLPSFAAVPEGERRRHGGRSQAIETAEVLWQFFHRSVP